MDDEFDSQSKYYCPVDTNGEEIENIEIDKNIQIEDIENLDIEVSPIAIKQMKNLQKIGNEDLFSKKLYILNNSTTVVNNDENIFNITGYIEDNDFNYSKLNLEISLLNNSDEKLENILCDSFKVNEGIYTLKCSTEKAMIGQINSGFSNLGKDNLIIYFLEGEKKNLNFGIIQKNSSSGGLSTGGIVAIFISLVIFIGIVAGLIIFFFKKKKSKSCKLKIVR